VSPGRLYYGWVIVAGLSLTETVSWGIVYYGFSALLPLMEEDTGWSRIELTGAFSLSLIVAALAAVPVGRWLDRRGPRALMTLGSCLGTAFVLAWARVESLPALYAVWAGLGLAMAATLYEPAFGVIVGWFGRQRHRALTVVTLAAGLASTIFVPLATWLALRHGWRVALLILAVILGLTTIPVHALVLRRNPRGAGREDGDASTEPPTPSLDLNEALRTPVFWVLGVAFVMAQFASVAVGVHMIPFLVERGWTLSAAAAAAAWIGVMQVVGRIFFTLITDRLGHHWVTGSIFLVQALGIIGLALLAYLPSIAPAIVLLGAANGLSTLARATTVAEMFGPAHYAAIAGALAVGTQAARAVGPVGASLLLAAFGGYEHVFWLLIGALLLAGVAVLAPGPHAPGANARRSQRVRRTR
jgi:MFS family permease